MVEDTQFPRSGLVQQILTGLPVPPLGPGAVSPLATQARTRFAGEGVRQMRRSPSLSTPESKVGIDIANMDAGEWPAHEVKPSKEPMTGTPSSG